MAENLAFAPATASQGYDPKLYTPAEDKKEYSMTWVEWASQNLERASKSLYGVGTIFIVPENKTLYITSSWISWASETAGSTGNSTYAMMIGSSSLDNNTILSLRKNSVNAQHGEISTTYPMPIKVETDQIVQLNGSLTGNDVSVSGFTGFLVKFKA